MRDDLDRPTVPQDARSVDSGGVAPGTGAGSHLLSSGPDAEALPLGGRVPRPDMVRISKVAESSRMYAGSLDWLAARTCDVIAYALQLEQDAAGLRAVVNIARQLTSEHLPGPCPYCGGIDGDQHWDRCLLGQLTAALLAGAS